MRNAVLFVALCAACAVQGQDLQLNDRDYFECQGVNVLVFSNSFNGGFNDEKNSGADLGRTRQGTAFQHADSPTISRTMTTGLSCGDKMREPLPEIRNISFLDRS